MSNIKRRKGINIREETNNIKIAFLHHWLVSMRGGEKVLEQFCRLIPRADIHTLVRSHRKDALSDEIIGHSIETTFIGKLPGSEHFYKSLLPLFPFAIKNHVVEADFILSSDANLIKGMNKNEETPHVCYCHSPPRYLWDMQHEYLESMNSFSAAIFRKMTPYLRQFDKMAAQNVDDFIANSIFVQERIKQIYGRESVVIHPPVELSFEPGHPSEDFYLIVSALVPYKRIELAIRAFNELDKPLIIIGEGSESLRLKELAGNNITFLGSQPFEVLKKHYEHCKAFIFPGVEDFGITPLEAQAAGKPVIAFRKGGVLETVKEEETGLFFNEQSPESLVDAVMRYERHRTEFSPENCRKNAESFSPQRFRKEIKDFLLENYPSYFFGFPWGIDN